MKQCVVIVALVLFSQAVLASEIIPPRIVVKWLIRDIQAGRTNSVSYYFSFDEKKHSTLTSLSKEEQIGILSNIAQEKIEFEKDEYFVEQTNRFVVVMVRPMPLEFVMDRVELAKSELGEEIGPPFKYVVIAVRKT